MNNPEGENVPEPETKERNPVKSIIELLQDQDDPLAYDMLFQSRLASEHVGQGKDNLLTALEEAGVLPETDFGNPYNIREQPQEYQQWFEDHPDKEAQFHEAMQEQEKALRYLYFGTIIGDLFGKDLYPNHDYLIPRRGKKSVLD